MGHRFAVSGTVFHPEAIVVATPVVFRVSGGANAPNKSPIESVGLTAGTSMSARSAVTPVRNEYDEVPPHAPLFKGMHCCRSTYVSVDEPAFVYPTNEQPPHPAAVPLSFDASVWPRHVISVSWVSP